MNDSLTYDPGGYKDREVLNRLYWDEGLSIREIGGEFDVSGSTIRYWMDKIGIDRRDKRAATRTEFAPYSTDPLGYERWRATGFGDDVTARVHRLVAVAGGADPGDVYSESSQTHHKNGIPWDNRPSNIEVLDEPDHKRVHSIGESNNSVKLSEGEAREIKNSGKGTAELAERYGVSESTIRAIRSGRNWGWLE